MSNVSTPTSSALDDGLPSDRTCTRCGGRQHLLAGHHGMGKYECDRCGMVVGFDLEASTPEFLLDRGQARLYTKDVFGDQLTAAERRVHPSDN